METRHRELLEGLRNFLYGLGEVHRDRDNMKEYMLDSSSYTKAKEFINEIQSLLDEQEGAPAKLVCPNNPNHKQFHVRTHVTQVWTMDQNGNFVDTFEEPCDIARYPDSTDEYTCAYCGAQAVQSPGVVEFTVNGIAIEDGKVYDTWKVRRAVGSTEEFIDAWEEAHDSVRDTNPEWNVTDIIKLLEAKGWMFESLNTVEVAY